MSSTKALLPLGRVFNELDCYTDFLATRLLPTRVDDSLCFVETPDPRMTL